MTNEGSDRRLSPQKPDCFALTGTIYIVPGRPLPFSGTLRYHASLAQTPSAWKLDIELWAGRYASAQDMRVNTLAFDPEGGTLVFNVSGPEMTRPMELTLRHSQNRSLEWVGSCLLAGLPDEPKYPCRVALTELGPHWNNGDGVFQEFELLESLDAAETRALGIAAARAGSPVVRGRHPLNPTEVPDDLSGAFDNRAVEASAERLVRFCRARNAGEGPWAPFPLIGLEMFCEDRRLPSPTGGKDDWLEGLVDPYREHMCPTTGGGWLVRLPEGMIGITQGFLERLMEHMRAAPR